MPGFRQKLASQNASSSSNQPEHEVHAGLFTPLGCLLLNLWTEGEVSAVALQKIAHCAFLNPWKQSDLAGLAALGSFGAHSGNVKRDLQRLLEVGLKPKIPLPMGIRAHCLDPHSSSEVMDFVYINCPDDLLCAMHTNYGVSFEEWFRVDQIKGFWESVNAEDPKLRSLLLETGWSREDLTQVIPLRLHGDGVEFQTNDSLLTYHISSILNCSSSLESCLLIAAYPKSCTTSKTWDAIWQKLVVAFSNLQQGCKDDSFLMGGIKAVIWQLEGDHEYFSNVLKLPHWNREHFCWECLADQTTGFDFSTLPFPNKRAFNDEMRSRLSTHWVFRIPGVTRYNVAHDCLHVFFTHGVVSNAMGNALKHWCWKGPKGSRQSVKPEVRLGMIFQRIQQLYRELGVENTLSSLSLKDFLVDVDKPHQCKPSLKVKGANCKGLVHVFAVLSKELSDNSATDLKISEMFHHRSVFTKLLDTCPMFPSPDQAAAAETSMAVFLQNFYWLHRAKEPDSLQWNLQYKHHNAWHLTESFRFMNPRFNWCFKGEDFVGSVAQMCHSVVHGSKSTAVSLKLFEKYRYQLTLKLIKLNR
jgi:hypothetical protein